MGDVDRRILDALHQAPATVAVLQGPELRYVYFNDLYRSIAPKIRIGDLFGTLTPEARRFRELALQVLRTGEQLRLHEIPFDLASGGRSWFELLFHPLRDEQGRCDGVIIVGTEVTVAIEARRALEVQSDRARRAEAQLRTVLEQGPFFVVTLDPSGKVLFISGGELRKRGTDGSQIVGRNALELYGNDPGIATVLRRALAGEAFSGLVQRPGATYEIYYTPVRDAAGALEMVVAVGVDVTLRLQAEEERARIHNKMQQTQKLESLGMLAGGIAHDFNNLLTVIQGNAAVALGRVDPGHSSREPLEDILTATQRAAELTRQMLAYSGKGRFEIRPLDLRHHVAETGNLLRTSISRKVTLRIEQPEWLPTVQGDASQLQQVIMNLMLNAGEAIGDREGELGVRLCEEEVGNDGGGDLIGREHLPPGRYVRLTVEDTGDGMHPSVTARIFDPFFTTKAAGRGLGLAAVLGIVRGHGGAIRIQSQEGRGTRFDVLLPAAGAQAVTRPAGEASAATGKGTVLLIDDEVHVRTAAARLLSSLGYEVLEAQDGEQGAEIFRLRRGKVDVVLLDVTMPGLSGEETLQLLRSIDPAVKVVLYSGYAGDEVAGRLGPLKPAAVLQKPFSRSQLAAAVHTALGAVD